MSTETLAASCSVLQPKATLNTCRQISRSTRQLDALHCADGAFACSDRLGKCHVHTYLARHSASRRQRFPQRRLQTSTRSYARPARCADCCETVRKEDAHLCKLSRSCRKNANSMAPKSAAFSMPHVQPNVLCPANFDVQIRFCLEVQILVLSKFAWAESHGIMLPVCISFCQAVKVGADVQQTPLMSYWWRNAATMICAVHVGSANFKQQRLPTVLVLARTKHLQTFKSLNPLGLRKALQQIGSMLQQLTRPCKAACKLLLLAK